MVGVKIFDLTGRRVLVTRSSARSIEQRLATALRRSPGAITLDFTGIQGIAPSFLDEVLSIVDEHVDKDQAPLVVTVVNPPTRLSSKFTAVGKTHGLSIEERGDNVWVFS